MVDGHITGGVGPRIWIACAEHLWKLSTDGNGHKVVISLIANSPVLVANYMSLSASEQKFEMLEKNIWGERSAASSEKGFPRPVSFRVLD